MTGVDDNPTNKLAKQLWNTSLLHHYSTKHRGRWTMCLRWMCRTNRELLDSVNYGATR